MSATTCDEVVSCPCPCGTVPSVTTTSPKMSSFTEAASLFPENWSSGFRSVGLAEVVRSRVERRADAEAEQLPTPRRVLPPLLDRPVVDELERDVESRRIVAGVVDAAVRRLVRHLLRLDVVPLPDLDRVETELVRDDVDDPLGQPQVLHARVAAVRRHRRLVGAHLGEVDADVPPAVHPRRHLRPDDAAEWLVAREGAAVVERPHFEAGHRPVLHHADLDVEERPLVAVRVRRVLVGAPLRPLHRAPELPRQEAEDDVLRVQADLVAEAAADVVGDETQLVDPRAQRRGHPDRADTGHLVVARQRPLARALVVLDERSRALEGRRGETVEVEALDLHDVVGLGERRSRRRPSRRRPTRRRWSRRRRGGRPRPSATPRPRRGRAAGRTRPRSGRRRHARARASPRTRRPRARPCAGPCRPRGRSP